MPRKQPQKTGIASNNETSPPARCHHCRKTEVVPITIEYQASVRHDGRLHEFTIPALQISACRACGEKVFTEQVDEQINNALRAHLHLLTPSQIRDGLKQVGLTQKEAARRLGIAEATLSRWLSGAQIQSRALDNLLRTYFAFPQVREALSGEPYDPQFGVAPV